MPKTATPMDSNFIDSKKISSAFIIINSNNFIQNFSNLNSNQFIFNYSQYLLKGIAQDG